MKKNIVLVEDDEGIRQMILSALKEKGHEVVAASNQTEALAALGERRIDLLLVDVVISHSAEGIELVREALERTSSLVCVLMSGSHQYKVDAQDLGVHFLPKPFGLEELYALCE